MSAALNVDAWLAKRFDKNQSVWLAGKEEPAPLPALDGGIEVDLAIIGAGFTGISSAWHFKERNPGMSIALLEACQAANGASGRNGGLVVHWFNGIDAKDPHYAKHIYDVTDEGVAIIEKFSKIAGVERAFRRNGLVDVFRKPEAAKVAEQHVKRLQQAQLPMRYLDLPELHKILRIEGVSGGMIDPNAGRLDGVALVRGMLPVLAEKGVKIYEHTPVLRIKEGAVIELTTPGGRVRARNVVLACNAYTMHLGYFKHGYAPMASYVIASEALSEARWRELGWGDIAGFNDDRDRISYASLNADGRVIFGGGSNATYTYQYGGKTINAQSCKAATEAMHKQLLTYLPQLKDLKIEYLWSGPLSVTLNRVTSIGVTGRQRNIYYGYGYSGHGVVLAHLAGKILADLHAGQNEKWRDLPIMKRPMPYPPEPLSWLGYQFYTRVTGRAPRKIYR